MLKLLRQEDSGKKYWTECCQRQLEQGSTRVAPLIPLRIKRSCTALQFLGSAFLPTLKKSSWKFRQ